MTAVPMRGGLSLRAYAKVNLYLRVLGRREDGYHELDTVFQSVGLYDEIDIELAPDPGISLEVSSDEAPSGPRNLVWQAAESFRERWASELGVRLRLEKRIPAGAGLGGGSSDAAAVLRGLRRLTGRPSSTSELESVARSLGADVPFFLMGGTARGLGRGDRIEPLPDLEPAQLLIVVPGVAISSAGVFRSLNAPPGPVASPKRALPLQRDLSKWVLGNDLEDFVLGGFPAVRSVYNGLQEIGLKPVQLSGSGGAIFSVLVAAIDLDAIRQRLGPDVRLWSVPSVSRTEMNRRSIADQKE